MIENNTLILTKTQPLLSPGFLKKNYPLPIKDLIFINQTREQIANILNGQDNRLLLIVGPCSIHDKQGAEEYATKLHGLAADVSKKFLIIMRTYFEKPRTSIGWKGLLYDPHLNGTNDVEEGLHQCRKLLLFLANIGLPAATEFLDPVTPNYLGDLISWACIGARTTESQIHRQFASGIPMPVAFKNSTTGNVKVAINGVKTALSPHSFFGINDEGQVAILHTQGNKNAHIVLRGGENQTNYDAQSIDEALNLMQQNGLPRRILVDCSHDNSSKNHQTQENVFESVLKQYVEGNSLIKGLLLESHLFGGNQHLQEDPSFLRYAVSLTDPCLDFENTEKLIRWGSKLLS